MKKFQRVIRLCLFIILFLLAMFGIGIGGATSAGIMMRDPDLDNHIQIELYEAPQKKKSSKTAMLEKN